MRPIDSWDSLDLASIASRRLNILPRYNPTDKICRTISTSTKVRRKTIFQFVKMIIRLLSHTFFILTFITSSGIFGYFGDLQYLEIPNFPNIRMLSLAFGYYERQLAFGDKDRFLYNDNADNIWRAPTLRLPSENITPQHSLATRKTKSYHRLIFR